YSQVSGVLMSASEQLSVMIADEAHVRIHLYFAGLRLTKAVTEAFGIDDWLDAKVNYAFDGRRGYVRSWAADVGTGTRASIRMHLRALALPKQMSRMIPAINQLGLVVRGIYGEGSGAIGNLFQISNQMTLGKSEEDIVEDLQSIVRQLIDHERKARAHIIE